MNKEVKLFTTEGITQSVRNIHTPGIFAKENLLFIQEIGHLKSLTPHRCIREELDSFLFMFVLSGSGTLEVNEKHYDLKAGNCALISCMDHYEHISNEKDAWELGWVHFNGNIAKPYYDLFYKHNGDNLIQDSDIVKWNSLLDKLIIKQNQKSLISELECGELLLQLLNSLVEIAIKKASGMSKLNDISINNIREYLGDEYSNDDVLDKLVEKYEVSLDTITVEFQKYYGISINEYLIFKRFNAAKELLRFTIRPIDEIVTCSGLKDINLMQKLFIENEKMTAEEYRMKWAQWIK